MAQNTSRELRTQVMYSIFVRSYSRQGTFEAVRQDLDRIKALGADIIWLLPIHPIGKAARKGSLGSPYAIRDYRSVNPEYGTQQNFERLVADIHAHGMKCIIDVVYNHTSPDSVLRMTHPEWFYKKPDGTFGNKVGEWADVIDLDYTNPGLWKYQIETLCQWAKIVDGFRCDVAPLIPLDFWLAARRAVAEVNPGCIWLSESVEPVFTVENRARGLVSLSDSELYQAFDITYEYDIFWKFREYLEGRAALSEYAFCVNMQEAIYPDNYVKLRFLENHDNARAGFLLPDRQALANATAFFFFQKGMPLLYAGQENQCSHLPSLFDKDCIDWRPDRDISPFLSRLCQIKKLPILQNSRYQLTALPQDVLYAVHTAQQEQLVGIFSLKGKPALLETAVPNGIYKNLIDGSGVEIHGGRVATDGRPIIFSLS